MLQQILADMYIDPELLAELNEEQKQILFFKMREEQVRRWKEKETILEEEEALQKKTKLKKANGKSVNWLHGTDDEVWVWVMGEHPLDKPYHQICDEIIAERARQQAQREAEALRYSMYRRLQPNQTIAFGLEDGQVYKSDAIFKENHTSFLGFAHVLVLENSEGKAKEEELTKRFSRTLMLESPYEMIDAPKPKKTEEELEAESRKAVAEEQKRVQEELKRREEEERKKQEEEIKCLEEQRTQQLYMNLKKDHDAVQKVEKEDPEWQESLRKSKAADERRRSVAKQARDDYKRLSLQAVQRGRVAQVTDKFGGGQQKPSVSPKPKTCNSTTSHDLVRRTGVKRSMSSSNRESIIQWFKEEQINLGAGCVKNSKEIASWFHGIITREESEELLSRKRPGSFLIRVSEKIKGYVLSYRSEEGLKHFLIDASGNSYSFLGVDQLQHTTLAELVEYHKEEPITSLGKEQLLYPCGQRAFKPNYSDLFN
ncbi:SH2 domain-containing protein 4A [Latimeria chalumnae]|uniref:SH2 domain-containing protein 4A n=1 Tax=Latimeria chalumnae TaxID=7897 RepID=UPI00313BDF53